MGLCELEVKGKRATETAEQQRVENVVKHEVWLAFQQQQNPKRAGETSGRYEALISINIFSKIYVFSRQAGEFGVARIISFLSFSFSLLFIIKFVAVFSHLSPPSCSCSRSCFCCVIFVSLYFQMFLSVGVYERLIAKDAAFHLFFPRNL